jgi:hypothetical protein
MHKKRGRPIAHQVIICCCSQHLLELHLTVTQHTHSFISFYYTVFYCFCASLCLTVLQCPPTL